jgi:hypothetical protein
MRCIELRPKRSMIKTDHRFIAKIPLMPNRYLWETEGFSLAVLGSEKSDAILVISDNESFLKRYLSYYKERFEISEHNDDYKVPADFDTYYGSVAFSNESADIENAEDKD